MTTRVLDLVQLWRVTRVASTTKCVACNPHLADEGGEQLLALLGGRVQDAQPKVNSVCSRGAQTGGQRLVVDDCLGKKKGRWGDGET